MKAPRGDAECHCCALGALPHLLHQAPCSMLSHSFRRGASFRTRELLLVKISLRRLGHEVSVNSDLCVLFLVRF